jgi:hypothetical protein
VPEQQAAELLPCPNCGAPATAYEKRGETMVNNAIYCTVCPLGLEDPLTGMDALEKIWNGLPRRAVDNG